ncbi:phenylacetate--CoA ligase family protein [Methanococcoides orientis]|uniref:phenylacetate--CoA ligase family protein n=1 Tax=Methanococcoides orientis TaxID=2822137 RepID=UPI001E398569|nr:phenylacetate--CoA ligase family protein [Methanococcoides orientis]
MFSKQIFVLVHQLGDRSFYPNYKKLLNSQWKTYSEQKEDQEKQLRHMISFAYSNIPYYRKLFNSLKLDPSDITGLADLEKLPILTKDIIKENWEDFKPVGLDQMKYYVNSTGGSTGTPFKYRLLKYDRFLSGAMLYRGWGYAGYELGDKMVFLAGSSLDVGSKSVILTKAHEVSRNLRKLSSFDMGSGEMQKYADVMNSFRPRYLRGYASSINLFASYIMENDVEILSPSSVFTTAEKLLPNMRANIEDAFDCDVYDAYGLNDGGVGAYECSEHNGLHIDTERSIMEIIDDNGSQMEDGVGSILATSLHNYAMPFIRYDTGDMGHIIEDQCGCGRKSKLLKEVIGRQQEMLQTPEGKFVHASFFNYIFKYIDGAREYQVIQTTLEKLVIKIVPHHNFDKKQLDIITSFIHNKSPFWNVEFEIVDSIERTKAGKYKFVISELK